jgi:hypothetical protein
LIQSNQKSSQQKCFFSLNGFALQIGQNHGLQTVAPLRLCKASASANICYAPATAQATMFCPLSPEAYLLTGEDSKGKSICSQLLKTYNSALTTQNLQIRQTI